MKRAKKILIAVIALAVMVSVGSLEGVTAEASTCPPHGQYVDRHVASSYPRSATHEVKKYNTVTNDWEYIGDCSYTYQENTINVVCVKCNEIMRTYTYNSEIHSHPECPEYWGNQSN